MNSICRFFYPFMVSLIIGSFFSGCEPEESNPVPVLPNCSDNIQNQGETGIDCGGPCNACPSKIYAKVDGVNWQSEGSVSSVISDSTIMILSGNGFSTMSLLYTGEFKTGTFALDAASYGITSTSTNYVSNSGEITFLSWNLSDNLVFGQFSFDAFETSGSGDTVHVEGGQFWYVPIQP